jgi:deoxyribodipyrimidine photo-lyase
VNHSPATLRLAALVCLAQVQPGAYARTRNHLDGAVTGLSPYITHGALSLAEVLQQLQAEHRLPAAHKLRAELGWRAWFRHVWHHDGPAIFSSLHPGPLPEPAYARELPADVREGRTGLAVIDQAVCQLYGGGTLHNHARMWLAAYVVHWRKVHWRAGADWMFGHLLDGDLASNHLSWQWVAGTGSHKPYLFNADNVARHAPPAWQVPGTVLDVGYDEAERIAHSAKPVLPALAVRAQAGQVEAALLDAPPAALAFGPADPAAVRGHDVWVMHPWSLRPPPAALSPSTRVLALCDATFHRRWPWSPQRWAFVGAPLKTATLRWHDHTEALLAALAQARSVSGEWDPHLDARFVQAGLSVPAPPLGEPGRRLRSFSQWWAWVLKQQGRKTSHSNGHQGELFE